MSLRSIAESDLGFIIEGDANGFRWPVKVTNPAGDSTTPPFYGFSQDIAQVIDPDTGQIVSGRLASVTLRIASLEAAALGLPVGIADASLKPWIVEFDDINGHPHKFKVSESNPDRTLGVVVCILEGYE